MTQESQPSPDTDRRRAWEILTRHTRQKNLRRHALAVEAAMRHYARLFGEEEEKWAVVGLLHDFDYEQYPAPEDHPYQGQEILEKEGYSREIRRAIMAHAPHTGTSRDSRLEKAIYAVDELTGFIVAVALVKPDKSLAEVDVKSVKKKMKEKGFAAAVSREDIALGAEELELSLDEHVRNVLEAMKAIAPQIGL